MHFAVALSTKYSVIDEHIIYRIIWRCTTLRENKDVGALRDALLQLSETYILILKRAQNNSQCFTKNKLFGSVGFDYVLSKFRDRKTATFPEQNVLKNLCFLTSEVLFRILDQ